jgi:hypothetical protein
MNEAAESAASARGIKNADVNADILSTELLPSSVWCNVVLYADS